MMKTVLFIAVLLGFIAVGSVVLYKIGEVIVESQNTVCHGEYRRWRNEHEKAKENKNGDCH